MKKICLTLQCRTLVSAIAVAIAGAILLQLTYCKWDKQTTAGNTTMQTDTLSEDTMVVIADESKPEEKVVKPISKPVAAEYKDWAEKTKPEPLFTDKQLEEQLNGLSKLKAKEKESKGLELQKDFNNPMEAQAVTGKFTDAKKSSYTINEYTKRLAMDEDITVKVVKVTRNDQNRITQLAVEETAAE